MSLFEYLSQGFKSFFEKIKTLDKKVLIGVGAGVVALIIAIVVILVVCLGGKDTEVDKDNDKDKTTYEQNDDKEDEKEATFTVKVVDADGAAVVGVVVQVCKDECVPATTDETGVATFKLEITEGYKLSVVTLPEGYEYTGEAEIALTAGITEYELKIQKMAETTDGGNTENGEQTATQQPTTTNPNGEEILGAGSKDQPYLETPNLDNMTLTTVSIPAGKTLYYGIYRVGNMILTINDANAYVIESNGTRHNASGGKVSFTVEDALASDYVLFQIGNNSGSAKSFTIKFSNPTGSYQNPTTAKMNANTIVNLPKDANTGHWYKYIADRTGKIRIYLVSGEGGILVQNNSGTATIQRTLEADGIVDSQGTYVEIDANKGDVILINVAAKPDKRGNYPAATITWCGKYN